MIELWQVQLFLGTASVLLVLYFLCIWIDRMTRIWKFGDQIFLFCNSILSQTMGLLVTTCVLSLSWFMASSIESSPSEDFSLIFAISAVLFLFGMAMLYSAIELLTVCLVKPYQRQVVVISCFYLKRKNYFFDELKIEIQRTSRFWQLNATDSKCSIPVIWLVDKNGAKYFHKKLLNLLGEIKTE